jgi:hypothetical protein
MRRLVGIALLGAVLPGCGHTHAPRLESADAGQLIALAHKIAGESACGQSRDIPVLRARAMALINRHRVPAALQEPLLSGVQALAAQTPVCLPTVPVAATPKLPKAKPPRHFEWRPGPGHEHHHGHDHGHDR